MNRVFVTGDCHGDYTRLSGKSFPEGKSLDRNDYVIILGDFGYWSQSPEQRYWRQWLERKPFTVLFVDGNHENFDMLLTLPVEEWNGGKVHRVGENILHLMRGEIFHFANLTWFAMGGAPSHDIDDGVLDPDAPDFVERYTRMRRRGAMFRVMHESWWPDEMPSNSEFDAARVNLAQCGNKVDIILTHEAPSSVAFSLLNGNFTPNKLSDFLEEVSRTTEYRLWLHGHYHVSHCSQKVVGLYYGIFSLEEVFDVIKEKND